MAAKEENEVEKEPVGVQAGKRYRCARCGSELLVTKAGKGMLKCRGEEMLKR